MKKSIRRSLSILLTLLLLASSLPLSFNKVFADNGEMVLQTINHTVAIEETVVQGYNATLILPFGYSSDTLDLKDISYTVDSNFKLIDITFPEGSVAEIGGSSVLMDVSYTYEEGDDTTSEFSSQYYIKVERGKAPTFSGTINMATTINKNIKLDYSNFVNNYENNDGEDMGSIAIGEGTNDTVGVLMFNGSDYVTDTQVSVAELAKGSLVFEPITAGTVSYPITAFADDEFETYCGEATLTITVNYPVASDIVYNGSENKILKFKASDFIEECSETVGGTFDYIEFKSLPSSSIGKLYIGYASSNSYDSEVNTITKYNSNSIDNMSLVPAKDYFGNFLIQYNGYNTDGNMFTGKIKIAIAEVQNIANDIRYTAVENTVVKFNANDFINECVNTIGGTLDYIRIQTLPSSSNGKLYVDYVSSTNYGSSVSTGSSYNVNSIGKMSFVPYSGYYGTVNIPYIGVNKEGDMFTGKIVIVINKKQFDADTIKYSTYEDTPVNFDWEDFEDECEDTTGESLSYVKFTLPPTTQGRLYINYVSSSTYESRVTAATKYYEDDIDDMTFVPYKDYYGTVIISYVGYNRDGESYTGDIEITVVRNEWDADPIIYETGSYTPIDFDADDFAEACEDATRDRLKYIKFKLPSSSYGVLYFDYTSSSNYGSKISASAKYYEDDLDYITFVPKSTYTGTVIISYIGYTDDGDSYTGAVKITVKKENPVADIINYSTKEDTEIKFYDEDFNEVCEKTTGEELNYVKFTLPSASTGKLYYNYISTNNYGSVVSASTKYYYDTSPSLSRISFVPYKDYYGTVNIKYTGYNVKGDSFSGTVKIEVISMPETSGASIYFKDVTKDYSWASTQIDYLYEKGIVAGTGNNNFSPAQNMTRGDFMLMLYRALKLSANVSGNFSDVPSGSYYYTAIATAKALGIAKGSDGLFMPTNGITREDAMVLVTRALKVKGKSLSSGNLNDLSNFIDRKSISDYAVTSVASLVKEGIIKGNNSYLYPKSYISRAEMAVILYRVLEL